VCVEDDPEVINAICEEEMDALERENMVAAAAATAAADDNGEDDDEPEVQPDETNYVSYLETVEFLVRVRQSAARLNVSEDATVHIDRFLKEIHAGNATKRKKESTLHDFFSTK
jgi:hypothetical protein